MLKGINWVAALIAIVLLELLGMVWYGALFRDVWMAALGHGIDTTNQNLLMGLGVVDTVIVVLGLNWLLRRLGATSLTNALLAAIAAWFFFDFTTQALEYLYMGMSGTAVLINIGYQLVSYLLAAAVLNLVKFGAPAGQAAAA